MRTTTDTLFRVRFRDLLTWHVRTDGATPVNRTPAPSGWAAGNHLRHPPGLAPRLVVRGGDPRRACVSDSVMVHRRGRRSLQLLLLLCLRNLTAAISLFDFWLPFDPPHLDALRGVRPAYGGQSSMERPVSSGQRVSGRSLALGVLRVESRVAQFFPDY